MCKMYIHVIIVPYVQNTLHTHEWTSLERFEAEDVNILKMLSLGYRPTPPLVSFVSCEYRHNKSKAIIMRTNSTFIVSSAVAYHLETSNIQVVVARDAPTHVANSKLDDIAQDCQPALPATKLLPTCPRGC